MTQKEGRETKKADKMHLQSLTNFGYSALGILKSLLGSTCLQEHRHLLIEYGDIVFLHA